MGNNFTPFVPEKTNQREFTFLAVFLGVILAVVLGAANAYVGLKVGMTVAATFPAAVVAMAVLRIFRRGILEENIARTIASVGEALVAGAVFTIPAFVIAGPWKKEFFTTEHYLEASALMMVGGVLGVLFVTLLRRVMVAESDLPFPESVAAAEIHKAGQKGGSGAIYVFSTMALAAVIALLAKLKIIATGWSKFIPFEASQVNMMTDKGERIGEVAGGGGALITSFSVEPALLGVGFIIGPRLSSIAFSGGVIAWGLLVPLICYFTGPSALSQWIDKPPLGAPDADPLTWQALTENVWYFMVRPIAVGGMLMGVAYTLFSMRKELLGGLGRAVRDITKIKVDTGAEVSRLDKDLNFKYIFAGVGILIVAMACLYTYFTKSVGGSILSALVMAVAGFFFAAVAGYLVGLIGSSNNPISGLTLSTLIVAALLMVAVGVVGESGVLAVLAVAAVVCCSCGVAGDMLQDLKVGHILGGTPWKMELGELIGVICAAAVLFFPLVILHEGDIAEGGIGFGGKELSAPQAGLMAMLTQGIVAGHMAWPLVIAGIFMGFALILISAPSPMLIAVGMYLPFDVTFTIFLGGVIRWIVKKVQDRRLLDATQNQRVENTGVLLSSGMIAGGALMNLAIAGYVILRVWKPALPELPAILEEPSLIGGAAVLAVMVFLLYFFPLRSAGRPEGQGHG
ncbi:MAG: oligopeptide transporter, OPT family [Planctomycetota bacterium]